MTKLKDEMPIVYGWYQPHDRSSDYTGDLVHPITGEVYHPPSMTKQEFVHECDINNIIREYTQSGQITHISAKAAQGAFIDLPGPMDFQEAVHTVMQAQDAFAALPSGVRNRFENDPQQFLDFVSNPANADELVTLGLATPRAPAPSPESVPAPRPPAEPISGPQDAPLPPRPDGK